MSSSQGILTITLSLGLLTAILGFSWWAVKSSHEAEKIHKIPKEALPPMRAVKPLGILALLSFVCLALWQSTQMVELFLLTLGAYASVKSYAIFKAQTVKLPLGARLFGKAAQMDGILGMIFGLSLIVLATLGFFLA